MKVFRCGKFYNYDETYGDIAWSYDQLLKASSCYATCKYLGYDDSLSYSLSYMYIVLKQAPETKYDLKYMKMLDYFKDL
jgi:hypothetical protein